MRKLWDERGEKSLATVKAGGAQIIEVDKASFQAAMKPVYDKFLNDPKLQDMVKRIQGGAVSHHQRPHTTPHVHPTLRGHRAAVSGHRHGRPGAVDPGRAVPGDWPLGFQ